MHLAVSSNWDIKPIYDVIATLHGSTAADQWVIRGNHHDAWVNGADDPIAGQAAMLEEARAMGELHAHGWTPARTIIYCAWDGEEPGLLGSVEWVETHLDELQNHAVAYINSDINERGFMLPGGTQDLENFISAVARAVEDPETHMTVYQRSHLYSIVKGEERRGARRGAQAQRPRGERPRGRIRFHRVSGFRRNPHFECRVRGRDEDDGTQYHSIYDDFYWYTHFVDTDFVYGRALSQTAGTAILRLADADLIPVDYSPQADAIAKYEADLEKLLTHKQDELKERNLELQEGVFKATLDPRRPMLASAAGDRSAVHQFLAHEERDRAPEKKRGSLLGGARRLRRRGLAGAAAPSLALINGDLSAGVAPFLESARASGPSVVQEPDLCARRLHGIRREAHCRRARVHG